MHDRDVEAILGVARWAVEFISVSPTRGLVMLRRLIGLLGVSGLVCFLSVSLLAQAPTRQPNKQGPTKQQSPAAKAADEVTKILEDQRLFKLHESFVGGVVKLAEEYENKKDFEKARNCYEQLLRLLPNNQAAQARLQAIRDRESVAETKVVKVLAIRPDWTDTGLVVGDDKPVTFQAAGEWTVRMSFKSDPDGVDIPKDVQAFPIGALIGRIVSGSGEDDDGKPFLIGKGTSFIANRTGLLQLRVYSGVDTSNNTGEASVTIRGSFVKKP